MIPPHPSLIVRPVCHVGAASVSYVGSDGPIVAALLLREPPRRLVRTYLWNVKIIQYGPLVSHASY